jgi:creatinine amidohydrolase
MAAERDEVEWARLTAHELRALAERDACVILPIASIEQHGPHLPVMTDTRIGREVAVRAARLAWPTRPTVVTPVVWSGLSEHHMAFGGTLILGHATFRAVIRDLVLSLTRHGFRDVLISNSHGGNIVAMQGIADELATEIPATIVATTYVSEASLAFARLLEDQSGVQHACEAETSMMLALEPDLVDTSDLASLATERGPGFLHAGKASYRWRPFQHMTANGVSGVPARASAAKGERLLDAAAEAIAALITDPETWAAPGDRRGSGTGGVPFRRDA